MVNFCRFLLFFRFQTFLKFLYFFKIFILGGLLNILGSCLWILMSIFYFHFEAQFGHFCDFWQFCIHFWVLFCFYKFSDFFEKFGYWGSILDLSKFQMFSIFLICTLGAIWSFWPLFTKIFGPNYFLTFLWQKIFTKIMLTKVFLTIFGEIFFEQIFLNKIFWNFFGAKTFIWQNFSPKVFCTVSFRVTFSARAV